MKIRIIYYDEEGNQQSDYYRNVVGIHMNHNYDELTILLGNRTVRYQLTRILGIENAWYL